MTVRPVRLAIAFAVVASVVAPAVAPASAPNYQTRADAKRFARAYWEGERGRYTDCFHVRIRVVRTDWNTMGYVDQLYRPCTINLNRRIDWTARGQRDAWWQVCDTLIHEWGHLPGVDAYHN